MALNPLYAPQSDYGPKHPFWKPSGIGDKVRGTITYVGKPYKAKGKPDPKTGEDRYFDSQKVGIKTADGVDWNVGLSGAQFGAVGKALGEIERDDLTQDMVNSGWQFGIELVNVNLETNAREWRVKLFPPTN